MLLHEATAKPLLKYIKYKHGWDHRTLHSIHWTAHALAIKRTGLVPHTRVVKHLHHILPTRTMANKFDGGTQKRELCGLLSEDGQHIMCFDHESRSTWQDDFLTALRVVHLKTDTSPFLNSLMLNTVVLFQRQQREHHDYPRQLSSDSASSYSPTESNRLGSIVLWAISVIKLLLTSAVLVSYAKLGSSCSFGSSGMR